MRNIAQYPITAEEILHTFDYLPEASGIGGLETMIKMGVKAYYLRYPEKLQELADSMNINGQFRKGCFGGDI